TKAQRALSLARSGRHIAAQRVAEQMRYHPGVSTQMFRLVQQKLADAARIGRAAPRVDIPADYLGALDLGFRAPFRKVVAGVKPPQPYPAGMALPQLVGVKNEHKFLADAAIVLAARAAHRMRRTEVILCVDPTTDVGAVIGALMRQTYTGDIRLTVLTDTPGTLPDVPDRLSPRIVGAPIQSKTGMAAVQAILDRETSENDDPLVVMLSGCAILDPTALDRAVFSARVSDRLFQPLLARTGTGPLETGFNTTKRRHKLFSGRYPFRDMQGLNFAASAGLMRDIGLPDTRLSNPTLAGRELAFRAFVRGAYFTPLQITHIAHHSADTASPEEAALYGTLTPNPWDRKVDGRYEVPRVTIYIPAYNAERYICDAVNSVLDQDVQDLEICICNDGSLDATADLLETQYGDEPRVHWTNSRNGGIGYGSNTAIRLGRAPYIGQVDSDDRLKPGAVRRLMTYLDENPETACVYGSCERIDADGAYIKDEYRWPQFSRHKMMVTSITHHFRMFRRSAWERSGYFREDIVNAIDYDIFLKMSETGPFHHIDEVLYQRRWHGENTSSVNEGFQTTNTHRVQTEALKRLGLDRFWELHIPDPKMPRRITYRRRPDTRTVLFWPDYSRVNPYQHMLYGDAKQRMEICAGDIDAALATLRTMDDPSHLTFHLHWINMVMRGVSDPTEADAKVDA
ncbi:MAG: glycosyltransferase, partial [Paracoccaceae bacterium]